MEMSVSSFKAKCLQVLERTRKHGTEVVITRRGKPIARLVPVEAAAQPDSILGLLRGTGRTMGDIVTSTEEEWGANA